MSTLGLSLSLSRSVQILIIYIVSAVDILLENALIVIQNVIDSMGFESLPLAKRVII